MIPWQFVVCCLLTIVRASGSTASTFDFLIPKYTTLPFDIAVLVAPTDEGLAAAGNADYEVVLSAGTPLPCKKSLPFYPSLQNQTVHKTALCIGCDDVGNAGCVDLRNEWAFFFLMISFCF